MGKRMNRKMAVCILCTFLCGLFVSPVYAQRFTDQLNRGLVAVKQPSSNGVFVSWRILGEEYYDTKYNVYRDGKVVARNLSVSNYTDEQGTESSHYSVAAIIQGKEQTVCPEVAVWEQQYKAIKMGPVLSRTGKDVSEHYTLNDICPGDLDGDGEVELLVKRVNSTDAAGNSTEGWWPASNDSMYSVIQAYKLDGTLLWTIDAGPNQISHGDCVEMNCQCYDWDMDGKAEVLMRVTEGTKIYHPDGTVTEIGTLEQGLIDRSWAGHAGDWDYTGTGREWLLYADGATCKPFNDPIEYPLKRLEDSERKYNADGSLDVYGSLNAAWWHDKNSAHRANKFFFGAPYLDGVHPSIFLARGIYTRIKMCALDVNPETHELTQRWRWEDNNGWDSPWFGQGYHNYSVADVDLDGRDEIVYGSMVIDDNGQGLSTTGLGHGDSHHTADLNPYKKGLEIFACNEDNPNNNYRDATTSTIYHRSTPGSDDGRCMAGNFSDKYLGAIAFSQHDDVISCVTNKNISGMTKAGLSTCFRIYWDGDLCEETLQPGNGVWRYGNSTTAVFDYNGKASEISGCNGSKDSPCLSGDILGDWREEIVVRSADNKELRVYTTVTPTDFPIYTLWQDHQYRNAMFWQENGYNQPPHLSYFLGSLEEYTVAPPPLTTTGREVADEVTKSMDGKHVLVYNNEDNTEKTVPVAKGAQPHILTVNAFSHTEGHNDNDNITTSQSIINIQGTLSGTTRLVRQGEGIVNFEGDQTHSGETDLWGGVTNIAGGGLPNSHVVMRRFSTLNLDGAIGHGVEMEYGAVLHPGAGKTLTTDTLRMCFGAELDLDLYSGNFTGSSKVKVTKLLNLRHTDRTDAPEYNAPVIRIIPHLNSGETHLAGGTYVLVEADSIIGSVGKLLIAGLDGTNYTVTCEAGKILLNVSDMRASGTVYWTGEEGDVWDLDNTANWNLNGEKTTFVSGDRVVFDDASVGTSVTVSGDVQPASVLVSADKDYTIDGVLGGLTSLTKTKGGTLQLNGSNTYSGGTVIDGGTIKVKKLVAVGNNVGNLGVGSIVLQHGGALCNSGVNYHTNPITLGEEGGEINTLGDLYQNATLEGEGQLLYKSGGAALYLTETKNLKGIVLEKGTLGIKQEEVSLGDTIFVQGTSTFSDWDTGNTYSLCKYIFKIDKGATLTWTGCDSRCEYRTQLFGEGTLLLNTPTFRTGWTGDWSAFEGTVKMHTSTAGWSICNGYGLPKATLDLNGCTNVTNNGQRFEIGILKGSGKLHGVWDAGIKSVGTANTWALGTLDKDFTLQAVISGNSILEKVGTGKMTVTSACDHTGGTKVLGGEVCLNRSTNTVAALGTGNVTVSSGALLSGKGLPGGNITVLEGGVLRPGTTETATTGTLAMGGKSITINKGGMLRIYRTESKGAKLSGIATLTLKGTLELTLPEDVAFTEGDEVELWSANSTVIDADATLQLASPGRGLCWNTNRLTEGILEVASDPTAIEGVQATVSDGGNVYDLSGRRSSGGVRNTIYIKNAKKYIKK